MHISLLVRTKHDDKPPRLPPRWYAYILNKDKQSCQLRFIGGMLPPFKRASNINPKWVVLKYRFSCSHLLAQSGMAKHGQWTYHSTGLFLARSLICNHAG
eukprot:2411674-Amphidinium_carterae.2